MASLSWQSSSSSAASPRLLSGFDVQVAVGRTLINKLLKAVEDSPHWVPPFSGTGESAIAEKVSIHSEYEIRLLNPRVRPAREQDAGAIRNLNELGMWIDSAGHVRLVINGPQNRPIVDYRCSVEGTLSIVARAVFDDTGPPQLAISFRDATVEHLEFTNGPDDACLAPMIARIVEFVAVEELRRHNTMLPLSGVLTFTLNPLGRAARLYPKSHYYRTDAGDLALGIAASMTPGGQPDFRIDPGPLRPGPSGDLVLAISEHYVNRVVANAVASLNGQRWRYDDWDELRRRRDTGTENFAVSWTTRLRSATVRFENGAMVFIVRAGIDSTQVIGRVTVRPSAADGKLRLAIERVALDVPGPTGIAEKVLTNVIYLLVREIAETLGRRELAVRLEEVERLGSGVIVTGALFRQGPADTIVSARIDSVRVVGDEVWVVYTADVQIA